MSRPLDPIDTATYTNTVAGRRDYVRACQRLGLTPRPLTPVVVGVRPHTAGLTNEQLSELIDDECDGHLSTNGPIGHVEYCDGTCK